MAGIERLVSTDDLKTNRLAELAANPKKNQPSFFYFDEDLDELIILTVSPEIETVVHYLEGENNVALICEANSLEIVGFQVEEFEKSFLPKYANIQNVWKLSDCVDMNNVWDMQLAVKRKQPEIAREVVKVSEPILGSRISGLEKVFA